MKKETFGKIFAVLTLLLIILPFVTTFSEQLTGFLQKTPIYLLIQKYIVPYEVKMVGFILSLLQIPVGYSTSTSSATLTVNGQPLIVTWNCLGWQSVLFLIVSFSTGLQGRFTTFSKIEVVAIGLLGTFWVNIARIIFIAILGGYLPSVFAVVFHDYFATLVTAAWLIGFWHFAYKYGLEEVK